MSGNIPHCFDASPWYSTMSRRKLRRKPASQLSDLQDAHHNGVAVYLVRRKAFIGISETLDRLLNLDTVRKDV
jgi:hypothetical protein